MKNEKNAGEYWDRVEREKGKNRGKLRKGRNKKKNTNTKRKKGISDKNKEKIAEMRKFCCKR